MTLVDTSVVIDYLRSGDLKLLGLFQSLPGSVCGTTRAEVLHGARNPADWVRVFTVLNAFVLTPNPSGMPSGIYSRCSGRTASRCRLYPARSELSFSAAHSCG
jgi:predicted nucleic acid-binding protein